MPQDSIYVVRNGDTILAVSRAAFSQKPAAKTQEEYYRESMQAALFVFICFAIVFVPYLLRNRIRHYLQRRKGDQLFDTHHTAYDGLLQQYLPYYRGLSAAYKEKFLKRTLTFMASKEFEFVDLKREEQMPLLISAAAVQLTFGLDNYLMDHFKTIYVMQRDYHYGSNSVPFQGHVNHNGIYLSWTNFIKAFDNYEDGDNVGLHEMAHALSYVNFTADDGSDDGFKERFRRFSPTGRAFFKRVQQGDTVFLGSYAATNYEEFWAVCVENFFERPRLFRQLLPELYDAMCKLLNQDMLASDILLKPVKAA